MSVVDEIAAERRRQLETWSADHDDLHQYGTLAIAASIYANPANAEHIQPAYALDDVNAPPEGWPWDEETWKPRDARRNLIRAAALIVAEIERLDRA